MKYIKELNIDFNNWDNVDYNILDDFFLIKRKKRIFYNRRNVKVLEVNENNINILIDYLTDKDLLNKYIWFNDDFNLIKKILKKYKIIYLIFLNDIKIGYLVFEPDDFDIIKF